MINNEQLELEEILEELQIDKTPQINALLMVLKTYMHDKDELIAELQTRARYDGLTGLERKESLQPLLEKEIAVSDRHGEDLSILLLDIDNFKKYNDSYGHLQGDEALKTVGAIIKENIREEDSASRYGGEEFVVILPRTDKKGLAETAERLRKTIESTIISVPRNKDGESIRKHDNDGYKHTTASIGGFTYNPALKAVLGLLDHKESRVKVLIDTTDKALYEAKNTGKNKYCVAKID